MMLAWLLNAALLLAGTAWLLWAAHKAAGKRAGSTGSRPPLVRGLPLLGSTMALARDGVKFISLMREAHGDAFEMQVPGSRLLWIFHPEDVSRFFAGPEDCISFKPAVERFTQRVFGLPGSEFFNRHEALLTSLRVLLAPGALAPLIDRLLDSAERQVSAWPEAGGGVELWEASQKLLFTSAAPVLFGDAFFQRAGMQTIFTAFLEFEGAFEVAASPLPHAVLPRFRRARATLLAALRSSLAAGDFAGTPVGALLAECGITQRWQPNLLLSVLWASQANSMPALFWAVAFMALPEQACARAALRAELAAAAGAAAAGAAGAGAAGALQRAAVLQIALDRKSFAARCVAEAVRLRMHSIAVRAVTAPGGVPLAAASNSKSGARLHAPRGVLLAVCPFLSHHDPALYKSGKTTPPDLCKFDPAHRAPCTALSPSVVSPGVAGAAFGGGQWRCPGRFFAEAELAALLCVVFGSLDLDLLTTNRAVAPGSAAATQWAHTGDPTQTLPPAELRRLVGFKVPAEPLRARVLRLDFEQ